MADTDTVDSTSTDQQSGVENNINKPNSGRLGTIIPGQKYPRGSNDVPVLSIAKQDKVPSDPAAIIANPKSTFYIGVSDVNLYDRIYLRVGSSDPFQVKLIRPGDLSVNKIGFRIPDDFNKVAVDGQHIWVELQSSQRPEKNGIISYYLIYNDQKEEEKGQKTKTPGQNVSEEDETAPKQPKPAGVATPVAAGGAQGLVVPEDRSGDADDVTAEAGQEVTATSEGLGESALISANAVAATQGTTLAEGQSAENISEQVSATVNMQSQVPGGQSETVESAETLQSAERNVTQESKMDASEQSESSSEVTREASVKENLNVSAQEKDSVKASKQQKTQAESRTQAKAETESSAKSKEILTDKASEAGPEASPTGPSPAGMQQEESEEDQQEAKLVEPTGSAIAADALPQLPQQAPAGQKPAAATASAQSQEKQQQPSQKKQDQETRREARESGISKENLTADQQASVAQSGIGPEGSEAEKTEAVTPEDAVELAAMLEKLKDNDQQFQEKIEPEQALGGRETAPAPGDQIPTIDAASQRRQPAGKSKSKASQTETDSEKTSSPQLKTSAQPGLSKQGQKIPKDNLGQGPEAEEPQPPKEEDEDSEKEAEEKGAEEEKEEAQKDQPQQEQPAVPLEQGQPETAETKAASEADVLVGKEIQTNWWESFWSVVITSPLVFPVFLGALGADIYWFLNKRNPLRYPLDRAQKAATILLNATCIFVIILIVAFFVVILKALCNNTVVGGAAYLAGYEDVCRSINSIDGTSLADFQNNINKYEPIGPLTTSAWNNQIGSASSNYGIDACVLKVVVQKESGGNSQAIGCDCAANGSPQLCPDKRKTYSPDYQFNWNQCSYGIGLTQWTIFPQSGRNAWVDPSTPSRNLGNLSLVSHPGTWYTVADFLDPSTSLELTAKAFAANEQTHNKKNGGTGLPPYDRSDVEYAFGVYVGASSRQAQFVAERMALYDICKATAPPPAPPTTP